MKINYLMIAGLVIFPQVTTAATLESFVATITKQEGVVFSDQDFANETTSDGVTEQNLTSAVAVPDGEASAESFLSYDAMRFDLSAHARNGGGPLAQYDGRAQATMKFDLVATGSGDVTFDLAISGLYGALTDRDDAFPLSGVYAGFRVFSPTETFFEFASSATLSGELNGLDNQPFTYDLTRSTSVEDGDNLSVILFGGVYAGDAPGIATPSQFLGSFFEANAQISGVFGITGDGLQLTPIDDTIPAVPLPAGMPLLLAGLSGIAVMRCRTKNQR